MHPASKSWQLLFALTLMLASCNQESGNAKKPATSTNKTQEVEKQDTSQAVSASDTLTITSRAAVFFEPDSLQMEQRKKEVGEEDFYIGADDYLFYMHLSNDFLDSMKLPVIYTKGKYLNFVGADGSQHLIRIDSTGELWGVFFFDPGKKPKHIDITSTEDEYADYFK